MNITDVITAFWTPGSYACPWEIVTTTGVAECDDHDWIEVYDHAHNGERVGPCSLVWNDNHPHAFDRSRVPHDPCPKCEQQQAHDLHCDGYLHDPWCPCQPPAEMIGVGSEVCWPRGVTSHLTFVVLAIVQRDGEPAAALGIHDGHWKTSDVVPLSDFTRKGGWQVVRWVPLMPEVTS